MLHNASSEFIHLILFDHLLISTIPQPLAAIIILLLNSTSLFFFLYSHCPAFLKFSQCTNHVSMWPHGLQHTRLPCPLLSPGVCPSSYALHQWCHSTISSSVALFLLLPSIFSSIRVFSNELVVCIRCLKYWSFSFSISFSNEYSRLISFKID